MAIGISVKLDARAIRADMRYIRDKLQPNAARQALNTTATRKVEGPAVRQIASETNVALSRVRWRYTAAGVRTKTRRLSLVKATRKLLVASIYWSKRTKVPAITLGRARQTGSGVRVGKHTFAGAFIAAAKGTDNRQVFKRRGPARYPLELQAVELRAAGDRALTRHVRGAAPFFVAEYERLMAVQLRKRRGGQVRRALGVG